MQNSHKKFNPILIFILFVFLILFNIKCTKKCNEVTPVISFNSLKPFNSDSAVLSINFKDCDGNIGLSDNETTGIYASGSIGYYNLYIDYFEYKNLSWIKDTSYLKYRIPRLQKDDEIKITEGQIEIRLYPYYLKNKNNYFRYEITLLDRDLNKSNKVISPSFIKY